jgi:hypothetical protein
LILISKANLLESYLSNLMGAVAMREVAKNEEFILNAISCTTNILFYDTAQLSILSNNTRI